MSWAVVKPIVDKMVMDLCRRPYPNHKFGCPNWGKKSGCPPKCRPIGELIYLDSPVWAIWTKFDFGHHVEEMRKKHPGSF